MIMRKSRFLSLAVVALFLVVITSAFIWNGCSNETVKPTASGVVDLPSVEKLAPVFAIQDRHTPDLLRIDGVIGTGTGMDAGGKPVIKVFTKISGVTNIPTVLEGIPVVVEKTGEFFAMSLTGRYRPVPIGVSVGNNNECAAGTIGCVVYKGSQKYILSNNHVLARENAAAIGEPIVQPGRYDNKPRCANKLSTDQVGTLADFEPLKLDGTDNFIDAAIAQYTITDVTCATLSAYYGFPTGTVTDAYVGQAIKKVGRTSSLTTGTVTALNVTISVGYTSGTGKFVGQIMTSAGFSKSGDSGSLVVTSTGNNPVGLLFAGTSDGQTILNPIGLVLTRFGATICTN
jgi:hypothetical protein